MTSGMQQAKQPVSALLAAIPAGTPASRTAYPHMCLNLGITAAYAGSFLWRRGSYAHGGVVRPTALGGRELTWQHK